MRKKIRSYENCRVIDISPGGSSLCTVPSQDAEGNPREKFVELDSRQAVPGDVVHINLGRRKKKGFAQGQVTDLVQSADYRIPAPCPHFGTCGGCRWQHVPYPIQLEWKHTMVVQALTRHLPSSGIQIPEVNPTLPSPSVWEYRNKMEYSFSSRRWLDSQELEGPGEDHTKTDPRALGFFVPGYPGRVTDIRECHLQTTEASAIRNWVRDWACQHHLSFYDHKTHQGYLRTLVIRNNSQGQFLVILITGDHRPNLEQDFVDRLTAEFPRIRSIYGITNSKLNDSYADLEMRNLWGEEWIRETLGDFDFHIGPGSFFQTNIPQTPRLYDLALRYAAPDPAGDLVYDLYTGTGTIAAYLAGSAREVIGLEYVEEAVTAARRSCTENGITNAGFYTGDMKDLLTREFFETHGWPDIVVTDPPRAGMHPQVVQRLRDAKPKRIVYVSCNPESLGRDAALLTQPLPQGGRYSIDEIQPVDMAPHTPHIETVVRFSYTGSPGTE